MNRRLALAGAALALPGLAAFRPARAQYGAEGLRQQILMAGAFTMRTSELAERRSQNPLIRQFAGFEIAEQRGIVEAMRIAGFGVIPGGVPVTQREAEAMQRLQQLQGFDFDRGYVHEQLRGHRELLDLQSTVARGGGGRDDQIVAAVALPSIQQHIAMLEGMRQSLRG
ncbi:MAG TPA: DUF4142 domain-containing protein [Crenalkalicoccus sp.]|jgi:predicted outer membrane protein|nr:DUF4142 domain-containing protein [Crenalkalicoccus sp.]